MNAQIGMDINERARRALTRVPPSVKVTDEMVADVADALRGAVRAAYQNAAVIATSPPMGMCRSRIRARAVPRRRNSRMCTRSWRTRAAEVAGPPRRALGTLRSIQP